MSGHRCEKRTCRGVVEFVTDGLGHVVSRCAWCERKRKGICRECPKRTKTRAHIRCEGCARQQHLKLCRAKDAERYPRRRSVVLARLRARNEQPERREYRRQYMANLRASHPRDAFDRSYQRVYMATRRADASYRAKQNARKRELRRTRNQPGKPAVESQNNARADA